MSDHKAQYTGPHAREAIERLLAPPAMVPSITSPAEGTAADQALLRSGKTIEGAAKLFGKCAGGDSEANNCAHFLSNAFVGAGYTNLRDPQDCVTARCATTARRPIRARDMKCWFESMATTTGGAIARNTGIWAVFQLNEPVYWGGHVVIVDSATWKYYGTGWYEDWTQTSYKW